MCRPLPLAWNFSSDDDDDDSAAAAANGGFGGSGHNKETTEREQFWGEILEKSFSTHSLHRLGRGGVVVIDQKEEEEEATLTAGNEERVCRRPQSVNEGQLLAHGGMRANQGFSLEKFPSFGEEDESKKSTPDSEEEEDEITSSV